MKFENNIYQIVFKEINLETSYKKYNDMLEQYKNIINTSYIVSKTDKNGVITFVNEEFCDISGYSKEELIGKKHNIIKSELNDSEVFKKMWKTISKGETWKGTIINKKKNNDIYIVDSIIKPVFYNNEIIEYISIRKNITNDYYLKKELEAKNEELRQLTLTDSLTSVYNRRGLDELMKSELTSHLVSGKDISFVMIDIDHFKTINDTFGHDAGDTVISEISRLVKTNIKQKDYISRYGGEEFLLLLPNTDKVSAAKLSNSLRVLIENTKFKNIDKTITASFGVSSLKDMKEQFNNLDDYILNIIKIADIRLYEAKKQGRNKVVCGDSRY